MVEKRLYAQAVGWEVLRYAKELNTHELAQKVDSDAITLIKENQG